MSIWYAETFYIIIIFCASCMRTSEVLWFFSTKWYRQEEIWENSPSEKTLVKSSYEGFTLCRGLWGSEIIIAIMFNIFIAQIKHVYMIKCVLEFCSCRKSKSPKYDKVEISTFNKITKLTSRALISPSSELLEFDYSAGTLMPKTANSFPWRKMSASAGGWLLSVNCFNVLSKCMHLLTEPNFIKKPHD